MPNSVQERNRSFFWESTKQSLALIAWAIIVVGTEALLSVLLILAPRWTAYLGRSWTNLIGIICIGILGILLYLLRQRKRAWYGMIEITFAFAYGWYAIKKVESAGYIEVLSIIAAVYLVVRGLDNYAIGQRQNRRRSRRKEPPERLRAFIE